mgnify:CR=1 FL=1
MQKSLRFMFAGQGAQVVGMGRDLAETSDAAARLFEQADTILGRSISTLCFEGPAEQLTESRNCQPAIYTVSLACLAALRERTAVTPTVCGGLSLGEFAALTAAGALRFEDGLKLVARRGEAMQEACRARDGAMAAVINADFDTVAHTAETHGIDLANLNCPGQIVISGRRSDVEAAVDNLRENGVRTIVMLDVDGAFHSRLMAPAADRFAEALAETDLSEPQCPVVQNVVGADVQDPDRIRKNLAAQVTGTVRWEDCVRTMIEKGVDTLVECGPGAVLGKFMRRIDRRMPTLNVENTETLEAAAAELES